MNMLLLSVWISAAPVPVEAHPPADAVVHRAGDAFVAPRPHAAVVIAVTTPQGRRVRGFGGIERDGGRVTPDGKTLYEIGSITKTFAGTLLADFTVKGSVAVDDPVRMHLPDGWEVPSRDGREITLLHVATHTSSLPRLPPGFDPFLILTGTIHDPYSAYRDENLRLSLSQIELERPIGSRHAYSNLGTGLLGRALAHAGGTDIDSLFADRLLKPLGLDDTTFTPSGEQLARLAPPFDADGSPAHPWHFDCLKACGGLRSTADDLLTYAEAAMGRTETPLRPAFDLAVQPWRETCEGDQSIGLSWFVQPMPDARRPGGRAGRFVWHGGGTGGYRTFLGMLPEWGCAVVVLSNSTDAIDPDLTWPVVRALLREHPGP